MERFFKKLLSFNLLFIIIGFHFVPIVFAGIIGEDTIIDYNKGQVRKKCSLMNNEIIFTDESNIIYGITESGLTIKNNKIVKNSKNVPSAESQVIDVIVIDGILEIEQTNKFNKKIKNDSLIIKNGKVVSLILNPCKFKEIFTKPHLYKDKEGNECCSVTKVESEIPEFENDVQVENRDLIVMKPIAIISENPNDNIFGTMARFCKTVKQMLTGYLGDYVIKICNELGIGPVCVGAGVGVVGGVIGFILKFLKSSKEAVKEVKDIIDQTEIAKTLLEKISGYFNTGIETIWSAFTSSCSMTVGIVAIIVGALVVGDRVYMYCTAVDLEEEIELQAQQQNEAYQSKLKAVFDYFHEKDRAIQAERDEKKRALQDQRERALQAQQQAERERNITTIFKLYRGGMDVVNIYYVIKLDENEEVNRKLIDDIINFIKFINRNGVNQDMLNELRAEGKFNSISDEMAQHIYTLKNSS